MQDSITAQHCKPVEYAHSVQSDPQDLLPYSKFIQCFCRGLFPATTGQDGRKGVTTFILGRVNGLWERVEV